MGSKGWTGSFPMLGAALAVACAHLASPGTPVAQRDDPWFRAGRDALARARAAEPVRDRARSAILFVGDGMGVGTVTAARILEGQRRGEPGEENALSWEGFPHVALAKTYNTNQQVPDSAGTATALLTGVKTRAGVIGVDSTVPRGDCAASRDRHLTSAFELAERIGMSTGIVTTTRITHATPAAAYGHAPERNWESDAQLPEDGSAAACADLARQLVEFDAGDGLEVALGGGRLTFLPSAVADPGSERMGIRRDGRDLTREWVERRPRSAYAWSAGQLAGLDLAATDHLLGLFAPSHLSFEADRTDAEPSLEAMTRAALEVLSRNPEGFLLLVEGGRIDHAHHGSNAHRALLETVELSDAVRAALAVVDPAETLVIVTADHSHVFTLAGYPTRGNPILGKVVANDARGESTGTPTLARDGKPYTTLGYANGPAAAAGDRPDLTDVDTADPDYKQQSLVPLLSETHAGEDVAIWAQGPRAYLLQGTVEQSYVFHVLDAALELAERAVAAER